MSDQPNEPTNNNANNTDPNQVKNAKSQENFVHQQQILTETIQKQNRIYQNVDKSWKPTISQTNDLYTSKPTQMVPKFLEYNEDNADIYNNTLNCKYQDLKKRNKIPSTNNQLIGWMHDQKLSVDPKFNFSAKRSTIVQHQEAMIRSGEDPHSRDNGSHPIRDQIWKEKGLLPKPSNIAKPSANPQ
eukprot:TRINITY_DN337_c0_g1_i1.p1 TRINITY_DN337_c0_g1~~TRINITY_DN337_c0_g1_i1.p1  ORF type:complete len:196 (+),score=44.83 TRINITY_DN337_c0_g1_i1:31-588(+)